jgi:putative endonuclease
MKQPCVYILSSERNGTLYVGVTSNLIQRVWQHKQSLADGFTKKYGIKMLVWFELHDTMDSAITKEKSLKKWLRQDKQRLVESTNPYWRDLYDELLG